MPGFKVEAATLNDAVDVVRLTHQEAEALVGYPCALGTPCAMDPFGSMAYSYASPLT